MANMGNYYSSEEYRRKLEEVEAQKAVLIAQKRGRGCTKEERTSA